ncbi:MAG: NFYB/HAP3 family transcription factor subunit [Thermoplasmatales archaeon]|nr:NFYB/HAP3 family transcription factor subunit [Thermoplasmatales archaeon]
MEIKPTTIQNIMKSITNKQISSTAVFVMAKAIEELVKKKTVDAEKLLIEENRLRKIQGLSERLRISDDLIEQVWQEQK